jgi:hypothetical protein
MDAIRHFDLGGRPICGALAAGSLVVDYIHHVTCCHCVAAAREGWSDVVCSECGIRSDRLLNCASCPACDSDDLTTVVGSEGRASTANGNDHDPEQDRRDRMADNEYDFWRDNEDG